MLFVICCVAKLQLDQDGVKTGLVLQPYSQSVVTNSHPGHLQFYDIEQNKLWLEVCCDENNSPNVVGLLVVLGVEFLTFIITGISIYLG